MYNRTFKTTLEAFMLINSWASTDTFRGCWNNSHPRPRPKRYNGKKAWKARGKCARK